jgi:iron complex transport system substrate-binding protein
MKRQISMFTVIVAAASLAGCGADRSDSTAGSEAAGSGATRYPLAIDDCGESRTFDAAPDSVLTIGSAAVSLLDAAGASSRVVARSGEFGAPLSAGLTDPPTAAKVIDDSDPSAESILSAGADVVYGYGLFNAKPDQVTQAGITVLTVQGECGHDATDADAPAVTLDTITADIRRLGDVFDTSRTADAAANTLDTRVDELTTGATGRTAAWVYFFSSTDPASAYGGTSVSHDVLGKAGLKNSYGGERSTYLETSMETLLERDPDWLVLSYGLYGESEAQAREKFVSQTGASDLSAVREGNIVMVPGVSSQPSPEAVDGLEAIVTATSDAP